MLSDSVSLRRGDADESTGRCWPDGTRLRLSLLHHVSDPSGLDSSLKSQAWTCHMTCWYLPKKNENMCPHDNLHTNAHSGITYNTPPKEAAATCPSNRTYMCYVHAM